MKLEDLIREADSVIEKKAAKAAPVVSTDSSDDITKLAEMLLSDDEVKPTQTKVAAPAREETPFEKIAHAIAIVETLVNIEELQKLASFEEQAKSKGFSDAQVEEFIEKKAAALKPVHKYVTIPGALLALGAGAGHAHGKKSGYSEAMGDVSRALSGQGSGE